MSRGIEIVLTHSDLDDLTVVGLNKVTMTEDAYIRLVDAVAVLGYEVDDGPTVVELDDEPVAESHDDTVPTTHSISVGGAINLADPNPVV